MPQKKQKTQAALAWTSSPPPPVRRHPRTELNASRSQHVQKVESRQKHCKNRCEMRHTHTHTGKHRNKRCERESSACFCTAQPAGWRTSFCYKTPQKPMRKQKQSSIPGEQSANTRVSAHASKGIAPPRAAADAPAADNNNPPPPLLMGSVSYPNLNPKP